MFVEDDDILNDIDVDINHFNEIYPCLAHDDQSNYYDITKFNTDCVAGESDFTLMHWNARSLFPKIDELTTLLSSLCSKFNAICISETWISSDNKNLIHIDGYSFHNVGRGTRRGGGVGIFVDIKYNSFLLSALSLSEDCIESIFIECRYKSKEFIVGCVYRPPNSDPLLYLQALCDILGKLSNLGKVCDTIICGDFNFNFLNPNDNSCLELVNLMLLNSFLPLITKPTRVTADTATLIDNIFINRPVNYLSGIIMEPLSDHYPIFLIYKNVIVLANSETSDSKFIKYRIINDSTVESLSIALQGHDFSDVYEATNVDYAFKIFIDTIMCHYNLFCPVKVKTIRGRDISKPWIDLETKREIRNRSKLYKKYRANLISERTYKNYRNGVTHLIREKKRSYFEGKFLEYKDDIKNTWKLINRTIRPNRFGEGKSHIEKLNVDGSTLTDSKTIANTINNYFSTIGESIASSFDSTGTYSQHLLGNFPNSFFLAPVDYRDIHSTIMSLKNKSCSIDNLPVTILKQISYIISPVLEYLVNFSINSGTFPDCLKVSRVVPLHKGGIKLDVSNYRPISILNVFSKILEKIVHKQLYNYFEYNHILDDSQFGFRKNKSTTQALLRHTNYIYESLDNDKLVFSLYLDLKKAFDSVDHEILLGKLSHYGIRGTPLKWFRSYLTNRRQYVAINDNCSDLHPITHSVPQGSNLGPLLFLIYINDISRISDYFRFTMFADDCALSCNFGRAELTTIHHHINLNLKRISDWLSSNKIMLNSDKTNYILYSYRGNPNINPVKIGNCEIDRVNSVRYLGVFLDSRLHFEHQVNSVSVKLSRAAGMLFKLRTFYPISVLRRLYYSFVHPHLLYGIELWFAAPTYLSRKLMILQKRTVRCVNGLDFLAHTEAAFHSMKLLPLEKLYEVCVCIYMYKTIKIDDYDSILLNKLITFNVNHDHLTRHRYQYVVPRFRKATTQRCILYKGVVVFNEVSDLISISSVLTFRRMLLRRYLLQFNNT